MNKIVIITLLLGLSLNKGNHYGSRYRKDKNKKNNSHYNEIIPEGESEDFMSRLLVKMDNATDEDFKPLD